MTPSLERDPWLYFSLYSSGAVTYSGHCWYHCRGEARLGTKTRPPPFLRITAALMIIPKERTPPRASPLNLARNRGFPGVRLSTFSIETTSAARCNILFRKNIYKYFIRTKVESKSLGLRIKRIYLNFRRGSSRSCKKE